MSKKLTPLELMQKKKKEMEKYKIEHTVYPLYYTMDSVDNLEERLGGRIKYVRELRKLSQRQLAEKMGQTAKSVSKYESGERIPSTVKILKICQILGVEFENLTGIVRIKKRES